MVKELNSARDDVEKLRSTAIHEIEKVTWEKEKVLNDRRKLECENALLKIKLEYGVGTPADGRPPPKYIPSAFETGYCMAVTWIPQPSIPTKIPVKKKVKVVPNHRRSESMKLDITQEDKTRGKSAVLLFRL